jgi:hypothetical protein
MKTCDINLSVDEILITIDALCILKEDSWLWDVEDEKKLDLLIDKLKICLHMAKEDE